MIETVVDAANLAGDSFLVLLSLISKTLVFSFNLSYFVGQLIVKFVVALVSLWVDCIVSVQTLLQVLTEDYIVFLSDIGITLSVLHKAVLDIGEWFIQSLVSSIISVGQGVEAVQDFTVYVLFSVFNLITSLLTSIYHGLVLIKNSLVLLGLTAWEVFVFLPHKIVSLKNLLGSCFLLFLTSTRDAVNSFRRGFAHGLREIFLFLSDIPRESLYGLLMSIVLGFLCVKYHRSIRPLLIQNIVFVLNQSQATLISAWTYLEAFTLWLLTNQMTPSNEAYHFAAEARNDTPADADQNNEDLVEEQGGSGERIEPEVRKPLQEQEDRLCVVCQDNERCTIILPCRHVCLCYDCCSVIKRTQARCPVCRHVVRRTMRVYI